jgi:hypothetical protein
MKWLKAAVVGLLAALVMFVIIQGLIRAGLAPFNVAPSAAFLIAQDLPAVPWAAILHFAYGALGSIVLVALCRRRVTLGAGLLWGVVLWLIMMLVHSPLIGWGVFGMTATELAEDAKLYLAPGPKYAVAALVLHLVYGLIVGLGNKWWLPAPAAGEAPAETSAADAGETA